MPKCLIRAVAAAGTALAASTAVAQRPASPPVIHAAPVPPAPVPERPLPAGSEIAIPCAPPVDKELRYRLTQVEISSARKRKATTIDLIVRFDRDGEGYRMRTRVEIPGAPAELLAQAPIKVLLNPVTFRVSARGEITAIVDEPAYWRALDTIIESYAQVAIADEAARKPLRDIYRKMQDLPDSERVDLVSRNVAPLLAFCGVEAEVGASWTGGREEISLPYPNLPKIVREQRISLETATAETARLKITSSFEKDALKRALEALVASFPPREGSPRPAEQFPALVQTTTATVSRRTGLTSRYTEENATEPESSGAEGASKSITLHLLP